MNVKHAQRLLISVRDEAEAVDALSGGADWIDLKEPNAGPLGAVSLTAAHNTVRTVGGGCPLSAALGELVDWPHSPARELLGVDGISVVKLGLRDCAAKRSWPKLWTAAFRACLNARKDLAAVIYADWQEASAPVPDEVLELAKEVRCRYLLIDTFNKNSGSSITVLHSDELARLAHVARRRGIAMVLAGNLQASDFTQIAELPVQMVAIRGAACQTGRTSRIDRERVAHLRQHLTEAQGRSKELGRVKDLTTSLTAAV